MKSKLFGEAIADAKAVRATALANAKVLLEEAFTPKLKSMLEKKLREELEEPVTEEGVPVGDMNDVVTSEEIDEILKELDSDMTEAAGDESTVDVDPSTDVVAPGTLAPSVTSIEGLGDVKTVEAPALVVAPGKLPVAVDTAASTTDTDVVVGDPDVEDGVPVDVGVDVDGKSPAGDDAEIDEEINLEELLAELSETSAGTNVKVKKYDAFRGRKESDSVKEIAELKEQFDEARKTVEFLREQLNEVNLLNAKLLYTNKVFKAHALNDSQKMKIIESFDLAKSVREVKLTFNNLSEALNFGKASKAPAKKAITESFASQSTGTTKPAEKIVVASVNEMASRFQKLAGIKK